VEIGAAAAARAGAFSSAVATVHGSHAEPSEPPGIAFDLSPGFPDTALINVKAWTRAWRAAARAALSPAGLVGVSTGDRSRSGDAHLRFRQQLSEHLRQSRGLVADPGRIFLFPGVNAAIRTLAPVARRPGRTLAFEDPGYLGARSAFLAAGSRLRPVPVDHEGIVVSGLKSSDWGVYVTPGHQYPLGARLSVGRRSALLEWAARSEGVVFEDDYDGEFRYHVAPMPAVAAMKAGSERVIYLGTASKCWPASCGRLGGGAGMDDRRGEAGAA
jgi:GntR family transcriptional regulator/MocR family aminotransferase